MYSSFDSWELLLFSSENCILSSEHRSIKAIVAYTDHDFPLFLPKVASELVEQDTNFES